GLVAPRQQRLDGDGTDVTGAAGDEDLHAQKCKRCPRPDRGPATRPGEPPGPAPPAAASARLPSPPPPPRDPPGARPGGIIDVQEYNRRTDDHPEETHASGYQHAERRPDLARRRPGARGGSHRL